MYLPSSPISRRARHSLAAALALACSLHAHAAGPVGTGTSGSCTESALDTALAGGGTVTFNCGGGQVTIPLTTTKMLTSATHIDGGGLITLDGQSTVPHFYLNNAVAYTLAGMSLVNGKGSLGGAIRIDSASVTLQKLLLSNNVAEGLNAKGGAIHTSNSATLFVKEVRAIANRSDGSGGAIYTSANDTLSMGEFVAQDNEAGAGGGAIFHRGNVLNVARSLFTGNRVTQWGANGGAIAVDPAGASSVILGNSTFYGNTGVAAGGSNGSAVDVTGGQSANIYNSTFAGNSLAEGVIAAHGGTTVTLTSTIVSSSVPDSANCFANTGGGIADGGSNLQFGGSVAQSCGAAITVTDPLLAPLADNGGFSHTMALQAGSPAIDAGSSCPQFDQRIVARPIGPACDIGAFEAPLAAPPVGGGGAGQVASVPALGPAGLALMAGLLGFMGARRRRAA